MIRLNRSTCWQSSRELVFRVDKAPPALEYATYSGDLTFGAASDFVSFRFESDEVGNVSLVGMELQITLWENSQDFGLGGGAETPLAALDGQQIDNPFGFLFESRGNVITSFQNDADVILNGNEFQPTSRKGAIMMLEPGTDIFELNPQQVVRELNWGIVRANPFDPQQGNLSVGSPASIVQGAAYFVVARDGRHFGFIQVGGTASLTLTPPLIDFSYRYEDSFILPPDF